MLASGRRVLVTAAAGTELASFVEGAAIVVPPADSAALAEAILGAADDEGYGECDPELQRRLAQQLSREDGLNKFAAAALGLAPIAPPSRGPDDARRGKSASLRCVS